MGSDDFGERFDILYSERYMARDEDFISQNYINDRRKEIKELIAKDPDLSELWETEWQQRFAASMLVIKESTKDIGIYK